MITNVNAERLLDFIYESPSPFHTIDNVEKNLIINGYRKLEERDAWEIEKGGKYFVNRNGSSIIAFRIPKSTPKAFHLVASHSDSPTFKIKENSEKKSAGVVQLSTEKYGGMLIATWFDRPLSVAGRVVIKDEKGFQIKLVNIDKNLLIIPSVAIHMNRDANTGFEYKANVDTLPLYRMDGEEVGSLDFDTLIAKSVGHKPEEILGKDLFLYLREKGSLLGPEEEFIGSPRLDDLECAFSSFVGFIEAGQADFAREKNAIAVCGIFDNEEVGSDTKQGAGSNFLRDVLRRITISLGLEEEDYLRMIADSFMISADNAHAKHPNHPEFSDAENAPIINGGVVIKYNANQKYTTDAFSAAVFKDICNKAEVPYQVYANRSDMAGGSTLGSISNTKVGMASVDIGVAQLAMHSAYETAGTSDLDHLIKVMKTFYEEK